MKKKTLAKTLALISLLLLGACSSGTWLGEAEEPKLPGERVPILKTEKSLKPEDTSTNAKQTTFAPPSQNKNISWAQSGGNPSHLMGNLAFTTEQPRVIWKTNAGTGTGKKAIPNPAPIVVKDRIFTLDAKKIARAFNTENGQELWRVKTLTSARKKALPAGGGLSSDGRNLYISTGTDKIIAIDAGKGKTIWEAKLNGIARAAPTLARGKVFVSTLNNRTYALDADTGKVIWEHESPANAPRTLGMPSPAVGKGSIATTISGGEIINLDISNGALVWSQDLSAGKFTTGNKGIHGFSDIKALPVIDNNNLIAICKGSRLASININAGTKIWQQNIEGSNTPWIAGNSVFVISSDNDLVSIDKKTGVLNWIISLNDISKNDKKRKKNKNLPWSGVIMAGNRLIATRQDGLIAEISPEGGKLIRKWHTGKRMGTPPIIAGGKMYILFDDATLIAFR